MKIIEFMFKCRDSRMTVYVHQHMHSGKKNCVTFTLTVYYRSVEGKKMQFFISELHQNYN